MNGIVQEFIYSFALRSISADGVITTPFKIVCHSDDLSIEHECQKKWPQFTENRLITIEERPEYLRMQTFLKNSLKNSTKTQHAIHEQCYVNSWMRPLQISEGITSIEFTSIDCKKWTDPVTPYLEIQGNIYFNMNKMIKLYFDNHYINVKYSSKFIHEDIWFEFNRSLPLFLTYMDSPEIRKYILYYMTVNANKKSSFIDSMMSKRYKIKEFYKCKKELSWIANNIVGIKITDWMKVLKRKAGDNLLPLTVAGVVGYGLYQKQKQKQLQKAITSAIDKMTKFY